MHPAAQRIVARAQRAPLRPTDHSSSGWARDWWNRFHSTGDLVRVSRGLNRADDAEPTERTALVQVGGRVATSARVHARDMVWSVDATHLGRDGCEAQHVEVVKDLGTTKLVGVSLGTVATGAEIVSILERARAERGTAPFVLSHDNGRAYCSGEVARWCAKHGVVELVNEPRTPQHNAACERGIGELKAECGLGSGRELAGLEDRVWVGDVDEEQYPAWCVEVRRARDRLDRGRLRGSRGYETAEQLDREMRPAESWACRESFHQAACCAIENAVRDAQGARARRRATRQAIYGTLERFGMVTRTRGGVPFSSSAGAGVS